jgi:hypothetical protein
VSNGERDKPGIRVPPPRSTYLPYCSGSSFCELRRISLLRGLVNRGLEGLGCSS